MNLRSWIALALLAAAGTGCSRHGADDGATTTPAPATLAGMYTGKFPCSNCTEIDATLWLRDDRRFFLRQSFVGGDASLGGDTTYALGRWTWDEHAAELVLRGAGPERHLTLLDVDRLKLLVPSPAEHVLARATAAPTFGDRMRLDGESAATKDGVTFTECLTSLPLRVAEAGAIKELRRQQRVMNPRGKVALTTVDAHLAHVASGEVLVVDRFVAIKPGTPCPSRNTGS